MSRTHLFVPCVAGVIALGVLSSVPSVASAQPTEPDRNALTPPVPAPPRTPPSNLMGVAMAFALGALVVGVNFIPSKRGHQD